MPSLVPELAAVLDTVRQPGDFFASGTAELLAPMMEVDGVGPIALPLLPVQAEQLIAVAERAPIGGALLRRLRPRVDPPHPGPSADADL